MFWLEKQKLKETLLSHKLCQTKIVINADRIKPYVCPEITGLVMAKT